MVVQIGWSLDQFWFFNICDNGQEAGECGGDTECCMLAVRDYDIHQYCKICK